MPEYPNVPAIAGQGDGSSLPERFPLVPQSPSSVEADRGGVPLSHYLWVLKRYAWRIAWFVFIVVTATVLATSRITPVYESTATIDIDRQAPSGVIGQDANRGGLNDADQFLATQVKLIQSDSVLRPVVRSLLMPSTAHSTAAAALPSSRSDEAPVTLPGLKVVRPPNTYLVLISYRSPRPDLAAAVANGVAQSYIEHVYNIRLRATAGLSAFMGKQLEELRAKMEQSSAALSQLEKNLSVINPEERTSILTARLIQLNTEYTAAQGERVRKQAAYDSVRGGSLEAAQASAQGDQLRRLSERLDEAIVKYAATSTHYGTNHPENRTAARGLAELQKQLEALKANIKERILLEYQQALNRETILQGAVGEAKAEYDRLNARSFQYRALKQEADSDRALYQELVRKIKEAGINSNFQNSSIRLADPARPGLDPVYPNMKLNAALAFFLSMCFAVAVAVVRDALDNTIRDPDQVKTGLQTDLLGALPMVSPWLRAGAQGEPRVRLASAASNSDGTAAVGGGTPGFRRRIRQAAAFDEAVRALRDSILLSDMDRRPRSLLVTSAVPREGKTTVAVRLAIAHSLQNRRTLVIDADLRRPSVHRHIELANDAGLSTVVNGQAGWKSLLQHPEEFPNLDVLVAGQPSRRAADRLGFALEELLAEAEGDYDLVIIDAPPLLAFAEPLQMAAIVDGVVVVALAGRTSRKAIAGALGSLRRVRGNIMGIALNAVGEEMSDRYYYNGYYGHSYSN